MEAAVHRRIHLAVLRIGASGVRTTGEKLREQGIKAVGFDFPQDHCIRFFLTGEKRPPLPEHVTHFHLLARGIIMFEYLCNMGALRQARNQVIGLPVKIPDSDGAPARVIAIEDEA